MFALSRLWTAGAIAGFLGGGRIVGDAGRAVRAVAPLEAAEPGALAFCSATEVAAALQQIGAAKTDIVVVARESLALESAADDRTLLMVVNPRRAFIQFSVHAFPADAIADGVSPLASIAPSARLGAAVSIGPFAVVEDGAEIGAGCRIGPHVQIARSVHIGPRAQIQGRSTIGMIGTANERESDGRFVSLPHLASVRIGADCQIGPGTTIARGTLRDTMIEDGCIVGAQVNIGHNCRVGRHCFIGTGAILTGSSSLAEQCWLGPGTMIANRVRVGRGTTIAIGSVVVRDCGEDLYLAGNPARALPHTTRFNQQGDKH